MSENHASVAADRLSLAARVVRTLSFIEQDNRVQITVAPEQPAPEIEVYRCQPEELEAALARWPEGTHGRDADGLLRWVTGSVGLVEITLYRR